MGAASYAVALFAAFQLAAGAMVFTLALVVIFGRWVTADESLIGAILRGALLFALAVLAISQFGTIWYWLLLPLALIPLAEVQIGEGLAGPWLNQGRHRRLAEAAGAAAEQPKNAIVRLEFARALLVTRQIEAGIQELREAVSLAPDDSSDMLAEMARAVEAELVQTCPACSSPNPSSARACRHCFSPLTEDLLVRALTRVVRPACRLLPRRG